ncbi:hypothetical protein NKDENANG_00801 [Candidatus Entotheonellaceae bacterium PAL068K]
MHREEHTKGKYSSLWPVAFSQLLVVGSRSASRLRSWWLRETFAVPLDLFRILAGLLCFTYFGSLLLQVRDFSSPDGLLDHVLLQRIFWFTRLSLFQAGLGGWFFSTVFSLACLGSWGIILGYRIKWCAGILFAIAVSAYRWNFIVMYVDDAIMHLLLFWLLLLPLGRTLTLAALVRQRRTCLQHWCQVTVPGTTMRCFLANMCLVYLVAGLWKLESPLWREGFAVYATLRLPIAYASDFWGPQHLPLLQVANHLALIVEPLLPVLLMLRRGHPLKWLGLLGQLGFHLGIIATLRIPFANLALMASAVLFFREEIMHRLQRGQAAPVILGQAPHSDRAGRLALAFLIVLSLAMMRRLPVIGVVHKPAYALLWLAGIAQDYQLFNWIDRKNYHVATQATVSSPDGPPRPLEPTLIAPASMRAMLLQTYLYNVRWMPVPRRHRRVLKSSILSRMAQRFCRTQPTSGLIMVRSVVQRVHPGNAALTQGHKRLLMDFRCEQGEAVMCRTLVTRLRRGKKQPSTCSP